MPLARIRRLLADGGATRLAAEHPLWELSAPWWPFGRRARRFDGIQVEILQAGSTLPGQAHLVIDESPQDYDVGGSWTHAHTRTFRIPEDCDLAVLNQRVLLLGGWAVYVAYEALDPSVIPDAFRTRPDQVATFAKAHSIPLLVQAFHDNDPWRLWVAEVDAPQEAAA